ncbi:hypothetical protein [Pedobacter jamesrossensis]|uniref:HTH cro/C1-type domain-containing protein n=1 Tax=Pedobacter jamesrossensis TaxID=1908238 RepID=A0ABV8NRU6_9SPHI
MSIHIGLMIWKEMKAQNMSVSTLAHALEMGKTKTQELLGNANIDVALLARISEVMNYNFFEYYESGDIFSKIKNNKKQKTAEEIIRLKGLLQEKNKMLELKEQFIKSQAQIISLFEKQNLSI